MNPGARCEQCGKKSFLLICSRCTSVYYCSKEHQALDWKNHKPYCLNIVNRKSGESDPTKSSPPAASSEAATIKNALPESSEKTEIPNFDFKTLCNVFETCGPKNDNNIAPVENQPANVSLDWDTTTENEDLVCRTLVNDMDTFGVCVVDNFLGVPLGSAVLREVTEMHRHGKFEDGQLVSTNNKRHHKTIRSDKITWVDGNEPFSTNIGMLIKKVDRVVMRANKMSNNGKMGNYTINGRTKAMVACYPGKGTHYVKHVDNPNNDGRCITAIYYLNQDWDLNRDGGLLRIFPVGQDEEARVEPKFDRILFFWSDRRNPHEVQPALKTRFAITIWYFDADERNKALIRYRETGSTACS